MAAPAIGPAMTPDEEHEHKKRLAVMYADEAERAVTGIETKLAGIQQSLATARAEAARARAEARQYEGGGRVGVDR